MSIPVQLRRIGLTPGKGVGANTGQGTADVVVPEFPEFPEDVTPESIREFNMKTKRWRDALASQFPIPTS